MTPLLLACAFVAPQSRVPRADFSIAITVEPGNYYVDLDSDLDQLAKICDTLYVPAGQYEAWRTKNLDPFLDGAATRGLKVVLGYPALHLGDTTMEGTAETYGKRPEVVAFKIMDELGSKGESTDYWLKYLADAKAAIRKHSEKPILVDIIPWELWFPPYHPFAQKYPASNNLSIDRYVNSKSIDWLNLSVGRHAQVVKAGVQRWGQKVRVGERFVGGFKGKNYLEAKAKKYEVAELNDRTENSWRSGTRAIQFYAWKHSTYQIMDDGGKANKPYAELLRTFQSFRKP